MAQSERTHLSQLVRERIDFRRQRPDLLDRRRDAPGRPLDTLGSILAAPGDQHRRHKHADRMPVHRCPLSRCRRRFAGCRQCNGPGVSPGGPERQRRTAQPLTGLARGGIRAIFRVGVYWQQYFASFLRKYGCSSRKTSATAYSTAGADRSCLARRPAACRRGWPRRTPAPARSAPGLAQVRLVRPLVSPAARPGRLPRVSRRAGVPRQ